MPRGDAQPLEAAARVYAGLLTGRAHSGWEF
jgi:hypothetical protein